MVSRTMSWLFVQAWNGYGVYLQTVYLHVSLSVRIEVRDEGNCTFGDCVKSPYVKRSFVVNGKSRCSATVTVKRYRWQSWEPSKL